MKSAVRHYARAAGVRIWNVRKRQKSEARTTSTKLCKPNYESLAAFKEAKKNESKGRDGDGDEDAADGYLINIQSESQRKSEKRKASGLTMCTHRIDPYTTGGRPHVCTLLVHVGIHVFVCIYTGCLLESRRQVLSSITMRKHWQGK